MEKSEPLNDDNYNSQQEQYSISTVSHWNGPNERAKGKSNERIYKLFESFFNLLLL